MQMAWQNIYIPNITTELSSENLESNDEIYLGTTYAIVSVNNLITIGTESVVYEKGTFKITVYATTTPGADYEPYYPNYRVYCNNTLVASTQGYDCDIVGLALGFDYSSKRAKLRTVQRRYSTYPPTPSSTRFNIKSTTWSDSVQQTIYNTLVDVGLITFSGGAGSGYIGNSLLSNKKMVGYNVPTSSAESTKTESVNEASETPVSGKPKIGNGFARIKFLREFNRNVISQIIHHTIICGGYGTGDDYDEFNSEIQLQAGILYFISANFVLHSDGNSGRVFVDFRSDRYSSASYQIRSEIPETKISLGYLLPCESNNVVKLRVYHENMRNKVLDIDLKVINIQPL